MKTSEKKIEEEKVPDSSTETLDPYAVDFFGVHDVGTKELKHFSNKNDNSVGRKGAKQKNLKGLHWTKTLPKLTYREVEFSNDITKLPKDFGSLVERSIKKSISNFTQLDEKSIECEMRSVVETNLLDSLSKVQQIPQVYLTVREGLGKEKSVIAINGEFASGLIGLVLGGKGENSKVLREPSEIEKTIIEFIAINVFRHLNRSLDEVEFSLQSSESGHIDCFDKAERGAEIVLSLSFGGLKGRTTLLLPRHFLKGIPSSANTLFSSETPQQKFEHYANTFGDFATNILMGETRVNANEILFLEKNDVILVEKPNWNLADKIKVFVGDSTNYFFTGRRSVSGSSEENEILSEEILFEVNEIFYEKDTRSQPKRTKMDKNTKQEKEETTTDADTQDEQAVDSDAEETHDQPLVTADKDGRSTEEDIDQETLAALENVMVNLLVNLGGRRLSLGELQGIRVGQIIDLGCRPNDPVEVVTDSDNRPIATGELIEIEGQLGVRLTKILV